MHKRNIIYFISVLLGVIYLISGLSKANDVLSFANLIARYHENLRYIAPVVIGAEIALGITLTLNISFRLTGKISFFFLLVLSFIFLYGLLFLELEDCGCMGSFIKISPLLTFARNIVMIIFSYFLWKTKETRHFFTPGVSLSIAGTLGLTAIVFSSFQIRNNFHMGTRLLGQPYSQLSILDSVKFTADKTYLVFLYSPKCSHCQTATPGVNRLRTEGRVDTILAFTSYNFSLEEIGNYEKEFSPNFTTYRRSPEELRKITNEIPLAFLIENDTIRDIYNAEYFSE